MLLRRADAFRKPYLQSVGFRRLQRGAEGQARRSQIPRYMSLGAAHFDHRRLTRSLANWQAKAGTNSGIRRRRGLIVKGHAFYIFKQLSSRWVEWLEFCADCWGTSRRPSSRLPTMRGTKVLMLRGDACFRRKQLMRGLNAWQGTAALRRGTNKLMCLGSDFSSARRKKTGVKVWRLGADRRGATSAQSRYLTAAAPEQKRHVEHRRLSRGVAKWYSAGQVVGRKRAVNRRGRFLQLTLRWHYWAEGTAETAAAKLLMRKGLAHI
eukprot:4173901-Prymnesium_polylepis.1